MLAEFREERRIAAARQRRAKGAKPKKNVTRTHNGEPILNGYRPWLSRSEHLPPKPFLDWLDEVYPGVIVAERARRLDISERMLRGVIDGDFQTVSLKMVDRAFVTYGRPEFLNILYPLDA